MGELKRLAKALKPLTEKTKKRRGNPSPVRRDPPKAYRFQPGVSGNPGGRPRDYAIQITARLMQSSPPKKLCVELGIDPAVTWGEAIMITLSKAAVSGDVSAAREVLAALGFRGTAARNLMVNVGDQHGGEESGLVFDFLRHAHGLSEADMAKVFAYMDGLPREKPAIDGSFYPDESYREGATGEKLLTEGEEEE